MAVDQPPKVDNKHVKVNRTRKSTLSSSNDLLLSKQQHNRRKIGSNQALEMGAASKYFYLNNYLILFFFVYFVFFVFSSVTADLLNIIKQQALTVEDKYRILDTRDKIIRLNLKKQNDFVAKTVAATVGTCPDMCPEKERLMRETQHQVTFL